MNEISKRVDDAIAGGADHGQVIEEINTACTAHCVEFLMMLRDGHWTLEHAHDVLTNRLGIDNLDLMQISGLARAMQIYQSTEQVAA